jgi:transposase-like protein
VRKNITKIDEEPVEISKDYLTSIARRGARRFLAQALELEIEEFMQSRSHIQTEGGHQAIVRNGYYPERSIQTGIGEIEVRKPRIRDRRPADQRETFTSQILPPYLRRSKSIEELIPWLYLRGISTGDFTQALKAILGESASGLSATTVTRLKRIWEDEYKEWSQRSLADKRYVYVWADGVYFNIRLEEDRQCILVLMGALEDGRKELIAVNDGFRESEQSWSTILLDLKKRGLSIEPSIAVGDGALGFWSALRKVFPNTREQRCWVHKTSNVLDKLPKRLRPQAKSMLQEIWMASTRDDATCAFDLFLSAFRGKYPKACECLEKDRDVLLTFYDFPAEHWIHLRTTNPIESTFATVRLRTRRTKGSGSRIACLTMVYKLMESASMHWRALNKPELVRDVVRGVVYVDGIKQHRSVA